MAKFKVCCSWEMYGSIYVEADTEGEAIERAIEISDDIPLPTISDYIDGSFIVDIELGAEKV